MVRQVLKTKKPRSISAAWWENSLLRHGAIELLRVRRRTVVNGIVDEAAHHEPPGVAHRVVVKIQPDNHRQTNADQEQIHEKSYGCPTRKQSRTARKNCVNIRD